MYRKEYNGKYNNNRPIDPFEAVCKEGVVGEGEESEVGKTGQRKKGTDVGGEVVERKVEKRMEKHQPAKGIWQYRCNEDSRRREDTGHRTIKGHKTEGECKGESEERRRMCDDDDDDDNNDDDNE